MTPEEALAAAICNGEAARAPGSPGWEYFSEEARDLFRRESGPLLAAITAQGYSLVPTADLDRLRATREEINEVLYERDRLRAERDALAEDEQSAQEDLDRLRAAPLDVERFTEAMAGVTDIGTRRRITPYLPHIALRYAALGDRAAEPSDLDRLRAALTDENEIAHGEAVVERDDGVHPLGFCAYGDGEWPCRTQRGIDRALAALGDRAAEEGR